MIQSAELQRLRQQVNPPAPVRDPYLLVVCDGAHKLLREVNRAMGVGYIPVGPAATILVKEPFNHAYYQWHQTMVLKTS